jgi:FixJ family two-component response regulator
VFTQRSFHTVFSQCLNKWAEAHALNKSKPLIAIVDDDESVCRALKRLVRSLAMNAETFSSGQEFLDLLDAMPSFHPDCLILDVQMPGMNGLAVQQRLIRKGNTVPVIFITAHDEVGVREKALAAHALAFLRKPFNDELLIKTLREALKGDAIKGL